MPLSHPAYAVLAEVSLGYPPQQGRFPRATHPCATPPRTEAREAFDLHVLSMPPAFVLSQDQTLMFNPNKPTIHQMTGLSSKGPCPAQSTEPIRATKRSARYTHAHMAHATQTQTASRPRDRQPMPPPAHPFIHQQCQSATPLPGPPPGSLPQETRRRGRTLIWPPATYRQAPLCQEPDEPNAHQHRQITNPLDSKPQTA